MKRHYLFFSSFNRKMSSSIPSIENYLTRYGVTCYLILGNIGLLLNMFIFIRPAHRRNSCSLYLFSMSFCSLIGLNSATVPNIYALDHSNPLVQSIVVCKLQYYFRHAFSQLMRMFFILACADCSAACSKNVWIRSLSDYRHAQRIIPFVSLFWLSIAILPTVLRTIQNGECDVPNSLPNIVYSIYILIVLGIFPIVTMTTCGIFLFKNLKQTRTRIQSISYSMNILRRRDRNIIRMLLTTLMIYICTTLPNTLVLIYRSVVHMKDFSRIDDSIVFYLTRFFLLYLNNSLSFWIFLLTSQSFRMEFKSLVINIWDFLHQSIKCNHHP